MKIDKREITKKDIDDFTEALVQILQTVFKAQETSTPIELEENIIEAGNRFMVLGGWFLTKIPLKEDTLFNHIAVCVLEKMNG